MVLQAIEFAELDLVELVNGTPHCKKHGAMNKIARHPDGGGIWRCIAVHGYRPVTDGKSQGKKEIDCICRAGCCEIRPTQV